MPIYEGPNLWEQMRIPAREVKINDRVYFDVVWRAVLTIEHFNGVLMMFNGREAFRVSGNEQCDVMRRYKPAEPDPVTRIDPLDHVFRMLSDLDATMKHKSSELALHELVTIVEHLAVVIDQRTEK